MMQIPCPYCGPREEFEFRCGGEGVPLPAESTDAEWARVLFHRSNPAGFIEERWVHVHGCRQWFYVTRSTLTHEITGSRRLDEGPAGATPARDERRSTPDSTSPS